MRQLSGSIYNADIFSFQRKCWLVVDEDFRRGEGWICVQDEFATYDFDQQYKLLCKIKDLDPNSMSMQNLRHGLFAWVCNVCVYVM